MTVPRITVPLESVRPALYAAHRERLDELAERGWSFRSSSTGSALVAEHLPSGRRVFGDDLDKLLRQIGH